METIQEQLRRCMSRIEEKKKVCTHLLYPYEQECRAILAVLMDPSAGRDRYFTVPIPKVAMPRYYKVIKKPMFFNTILEKINKHEYQNATEFAEDCRLVVENCLKMNKVDSEVVKQGVQISLILEEKLATSQELKSLGYEKIFPETPNTSHFATQMAKLKKEDVRVLGAYVRIFEGKAPSEKFTIQPPRLKLASRLFIHRFLAEHTPKAAIDLVLPKPPTPMPTMAGAPLHQQLGQPPPTHHLPQQIQAVGHGIAPPPPLVVQSGGGLAPQQQQHAYAVQQQQPQYVQEPEPPAPLVNGNPRVNRHDDYYASVSPTRIEPDMEGDDLIDDDEDDEGGDGDANQTSSHYLDYSSGEVAEAGGRESGVSNNAGVVPQQAPSQNPDDDDDDVFHH